MAITASRATSYADTWRPVPVGAFGTGPGSPWALAGLARGSPMGDDGPETELSLCYSLAPSSRSRFAGADRRWEPLASRRTPARGFPVGLHRSDLGSHFRIDGLIVLNSRMSSIHSSGVG